MLGALRRVGGTAMVHESYRKLHRLLTDPSQRQRANLLRHIGDTVGISLDVIEVLDPVLLRPEIVRRVHSSKEAASLNRAVELLRTSCSTATDEAITESIGRLSNEAALTSWLEKWARKADRLPTPIPETDDLRPLNTGAILMDRGRSYRNCLGHKIAQSMLGYSFHLESKHAKVIAELTALGHGRWLLEGLYGLRNRRPDPAVADTIRTTLSGHGVITPATDVIPRDLQLVGRMFGVYGRETLGAYFDHEAPEA